GRRHAAKLNGMLAFAMWERDSKQGFIARGRLGLKPLFLSKTDKRMRLASSLPALHKGGDIRGMLDPVPHIHYLNFNAFLHA
ncbi:N-acetylglutaminylglutamine amidotransferase, partial [Pseudomonas syringae pv. tagetis]